MAAMNEPAPESSIELRAHEMLLAAYGAAPLEVFGDEKPPAEGEKDTLGLAKAAADLLVSSRFAKFVDEGRTQIELSNAGRYWALHGGLLAYLKEDPVGRGGGAGGRGRNPEMESLRMEYMRLRLGTFWWTFGLSIASFIFASMSLVIAYFFGGLISR